MSKQVKTALSAAGAYLGIVAMGAVALIPAVYQAMM